MEIAVSDKPAGHANTSRHQTRANDNRRTPLGMGRSVFPHDAVARIFRPARSVTTSAHCRHPWKLVFELRSPSFMEPLMGYTGSRDTLKQVELRFPTLDQAIRYAERQGLQYRVETMEQDRRNDTDKHRRASRVFSDSTLDRLGLSRLSECYGRAMNYAANRNDPDGSGNWAEPMGIVTDSTLSLDAKRAILMNWAWTEYLIDQATNEGMPENNRPSRLGEVEQALLALEREAACGPNRTGTRKAA